MALAMNPNNFSSASPGRVVSIDADWGKDWAFIPRSLPPQWKMPTRIWPLISEVSAAIGLLEGVARSLPDSSLLLRPIQNREALQSSAIEGTFATAKDLLLFDAEATDSSTRKESTREVYNYVQAIEQADENDLPVSRRLIQRLHATLMRGVRGGNKDPGNFRRVQVGIGKSKFIPAPAFEINELISDLEKFIHRERTKGSHHPLVDCFLVHYQFETIHPFQDGNGRVGRLLLSKMLKDASDLSKPWLYMSEYFGDNKAEYCDRLFNVSVRDEWTEWIEFSLTGLRNQAKSTLLRCEELRKLRENYLTKVGTLARGSARLNRIVDNVFVRPFISVTEIASLVDVAYQTAKSDAIKLESVGVLHEMNGVTPLTYFAPDVYRIVYQELDSKIEE